MTQESGYTKEGLPIISREVIDVFHRDIEIDSDNGNENAPEKVERMRSSNPELLRYLEGQLDRIYQRRGLYPGQRLGENFEMPALHTLADQFAEGFIICYELMRRQAESNILEGE